VPHYFKTLYRAIRDACRRYNPEFLLRAEHCADFFYPEFLTSTAHFFVTAGQVNKHNPPTDAQLMPILFRFIYFTIADAFLREPDGPVEIEVEYLDQGTTPFGLDYDSTDETAPIKGAFKAAQPCPRANSGEWKTHAFILPDARFANRQHLGADFRLSAEEEDLHVRRVEVKRSR